MVIALIREAKAAGGSPFVQLKDDRLIRELCLCYSEEEMQRMADFELYRLRQMDAFIGIRGFTNISELADVPPDQLRRIRKLYLHPVHLQERNQHTKWVAVRWPTQAMAQRAEMSTEAFEEFFFTACNVDYAKMEAAMEGLVDLMRETDQVRICGPGDTDISFSIRGMPTCKYAGRHNVPDGELFTAPVRYSINGRIRYNVPSSYYGTTFTNVCFDFEDGRIVEATSSETVKLNRILDQDPGARYVGEFAFGFNPMITRPMRDGLFDEKMRGTIHLTPGNAYQECDNGNRSSIHWDLILDQTAPRGGGEIYFDGVLIRKDGRFVLDELQELNPDHLVITPPDHEEA